MSNTFFNLGQMASPINYKEGISPHIPFFIGGGGGGGKCPTLICTTYIYILCAMVYNYFYAYFKSIYNVIWDFLTKLDEK